MNTKIAILTSVANFNLYNKSSQMFPRGIDRFVIDGTKGMYGIDSIIYMMNKFKNLNYEWIVMADEDMLFTNPNEIFKLIDYMKNNNFTVAGVRDGGVISHRNKNPIAINTFFTIFNFQTVKKKWNKKQMLTNQYITKDEFLFEEKLPYNYDLTSTYEPYYCFYFWLLRLGYKILYLDAKMLDTGDYISNAVYNYNQKIIGYHTWYARSYGINTKHTDRIDKIFNSQKKETFHTENSLQNKLTIWNDYFFPYKKMIKKIFKRVSKRLKNNNFLNE